MPATLDKLPAHSAHRVKPGFTREDLARKFANWHFSVGAEIGVADGRYALTLCQAIPGLTLYAIDPWAPYHGNSRGGGTDQHERNYALAQERLSSYRVCFVRKLSIEAAPQIREGSLDFVFIDGNHDYAYVKADLEAWVPKVRSGGVVAGHDYYHFGDDGVVRAVDEYTDAHGLEFIVCDERERAWLWVQP